MAKQVEILKGDKPTKLKLLDCQRFKIFIINYESVAGLKDRLLNYCFECMIVDESHRIKNIKADRTKNVIEVGRYVRYKYILTGSPILNSPIDIFSQYLFLDNGKTFGGNFFSFRNKYFVDVNAGFNKKREYFPKFTVRTNLLPEINEKILKQASVIKKVDCLDLPSKIYENFYLEMSTEIKAAYKSMEKELITLFENDPTQAMVASTAAVKLVRLSQITSGYLKLADTNTIKRFKENPKINAVKEILEEIAETAKVIIWAIFIENIKMLQEALVEYNPAVIYGETNDKFAEQEKFKNDTTCRIMIANPQAAGIAINLVEASYAIYYSQNFSLEHRLQSEDRCHRIGSEIHDKITYIDLIYQKTIDEKVCFALKNKQKLSDAVLGVINQMKGGDLHD
jgi:SNF2 family DNA or RNA helicase